MKKRINRGNTPIDSITNAAVNTLLAVGIGLSYAVTHISNAAFPFIKRNYNNNSRCCFNGFIHDQSTDSVSRLKIGYKNASFNGCGCISAYNAALLIGRSISPAEIIKYYEKRGGLFFDGLLGVNPLAVKMLFRSNGHSAKIRNFPRDIDRLIAEYGVCVLMYAHRRGMHFVAIEFTGIQGERFRIYSAYTGIDAPFCCDSIEEWLKRTENRFAAVSVILLRNKRLALLSRSNISSCHSACINPQY